MVGMAVEVEFWITVGAGPATCLTNGNEGFLKPVRQELADSFNGVETLMARGFIGACEIFHK